jgi:hypothetical protein
MWSTGTAAHDPLRNRRLTPYITNPPRPIRATNASNPGLYCACRNLRTQGGSVPCPPPEIA